LTGKRSKSGRMRRSSSPCPANGIVSPEGMIEIIAFGLSGAFAALAGIVLAARLSSGSPDLANQLLLPAMAAVVVGGTAITGGVGSIGRTMVGALIVSIVRIGMTYIGVDIFAQQIVFGAALIFAVFVTIDRSKLPIIK
jgi:ribose transport system permease protein